ncbi:MAG: methyltransferase domain-containing protein [Actinobacteria bacterium]|nr:methyltransferase domain-containing protein [Actinomycetota bacterium]MSW05180.1 methyltransferase domain-containing protein [Actinomycetota bacterium]MSX82413.1 methyltransferase domain-containing protein [Actinomycetota bacterium]MSY06374.1 methyltransferase domain-containing protein [Actinomycetota bacterium]MSZ29104.1 methyltransferase domain-containing protein [Actinomycetota bacterium]
MEILNRILPWDGWGGRIMATVMASGNADMELAAVELVDPRPDSNVAMIGCGPGVGVVAGARRAPNGIVIGLDPSAVMVERTRTRCRRERVEHLTRVERAAAESLPLPDRSQDAVVSVNNIQLWSDRSIGLDECVRVLAPGGVLVVLLHTWAMPDDVPYAEWVAELRTDLSARDVQVEPPQTQRFRSGPAMVLIGRSAR